MQSGYQESSVRGFTLLETMISLSLFAIITVMAFQIFGNIGVLRTRVSSGLDLNTEMHAATEKLVGLVKDGGDIDYEEYWNRFAVGTATASGHYRDFSGYGNYGSGGGAYGSGLYYCANVGNTGGCLSPGKQRYGEYREQFVDYNSDGGIDVGSDDDEDLGSGPKAFTGGTALNELYLIKKGMPPERTYFRWTFKPDPYAPPGAVCTTTGANAGSGCLGNIEMLRLSGRDLGLEHSGAVTSSGKYDGRIDTWECHTDYNCTLPSGADSEWVSIFPDYINVKNVEFYPYPEKDFRYAWKEANDSLTVNSYVRIKMTLGLAWEKRRKITSPSLDTTITTTVNLSR